MLWQCAQLYVNNVFSDVIILFQNSIANELFQINQ